MYHIPTMNAPDISLSNRPTLRQSAIPSPFVLSEVEGPQIALQKRLSPHVTL